ncbi:DUF5056 domain-containing protein [Dyella monticola]|uniref:DUF5056 domain-containing protein n=1 Tax=Dyella monticola TaxID=1927958 RepID=A0A370WT90_9GAMM|nr:DUF5056 domain-containing protein [Dyella monticola]RDS79236.1 DUF5056 domain-containing protein [Dyella monticola]
MNQSSDDDTIDALLRKQFDGPIPDDGFSERVMQQLPPRRSRISWPLWAGLLAGIMTCWLSLLSKPLPHLDWRNWMHGDFSTAAITLIMVTAGMTLLACVWSIAEADDR